MVSGLIEVIVDPEIFDIRSSGLGSRNSGGDRLQKIAMACLDISPKGSPSARWFARHEYDDIYAAKREYVADSEGDAQWLCDALNGAGAK